MLFRTYSTEPTPQTKIMRRVVERRKALGLTQKAVSDRIANSELYGEYTATSYRNLETQNFEDESKPRDALNKQLVIAISEALECTVPEIATEYELECIRERPYRRKQWPEFMLKEESDENPSRAVPSPDRTTLRIHAYMRQAGYSTVPDIGRVMRRFYIEETDKTLYRVFNMKSENRKVRARVVTYEMLEKLTTLFRNRGTPGFRTEWLLQCTDMCPHCDERLIYY